MNTRNFVSLTKITLAGITIFFSLTAAAAENDFNEARDFSIRMSMFSEQNAKDWELYRKEVAGEPLTRAKIGQYGSHVSSHIALAASSLALVGVLPQYFQLSAFKELAIGTYYLPLQWTVLSVAAPRLAGWMLAGKLSTLIGGLVVPAGTYSGHVILLVKSRETTQVIALSEREMGTFKGKVRMPKASPGALLIKKKNSYTSLEVSRIALVNSFEAKLQEIDKKINFLGQAHREYIETRINYYQTMRDFESNRAAYFRSISKLLAEQDSPWGERPLKD